MSSHFSAAVALFEIALERDEGWAMDTAVSGRSFKTKAVWTRRGWAVFPVPKMRTLDRGRACFPAAGRRN
jgi:hypothetical protein